MTENKNKVVMEIKIWFGNRCKELRQELRLSQEKFALKIEMDRSYYASVEGGKRNISLENIEKILNGLNVSFHDFFNI